MRARLDATDWRILKELQSNGRISNVDLARKVGISPPPCLRRVRALEQAGMIAGYFGMLDEKSVGFEVIAFAMVGLHSQAEADRVMRESPKPVVLVPPGAADISGKRIEIKRVLVPLDGSELADRSLEFLLGLTHIGELEFVLLGVVHNPDDVAFVKRRLHVAADRFHGRSAAATPRVIFAGDAANAIASAVREFFVDMIAMSTRGEGGLRRLILGSVAEGVVRAAEVPVLLLTPTMLTARDVAESMITTAE